MEYKVNKIDPDLRERINNAAGEGKVHAKTGIKITKDSKKNEQREKFDLKKYSSNKRKSKIMVNAVKIQEVQVDAVNKDMAFQDNITGKYIDVRK